jgi:hypothetical protein
VYDEEQDLGVLGKGAAAIEASRDGIEWVSLADGIEPRRWGIELQWFGLLPDSVLGTETIWLRIRLITGGKGSPDIYCPAQFLRGDMNTRENRSWRFLIEAECAPADLRS